MKARSIPLLTLGFVFGAIGIATGDRDILVSTVILAVGTGAWVTLRAWLHSRDSVSAKRWSKSAGLITMAGLLVVGSAVEYSQGSAISTTIALLAIAVLCGFAAVRIAREP
jgi:hypothetical protein